MKLNGNPGYEVNAVIPFKLFEPLMHMLKMNGGHLIKVAMTGNRLAVPRKGRTPAREIILDTLRRTGSELYRGDLREALELSGHSPASVGPLCTLLQQEGRIFSPRRGFWQLRT
ncbi:MAG TPA: hypothetical protein VF077_03810 [Nitrospiraceae bacterium]